MKQSSLFLILIFLFTISLLFGQKSNDEIHLKNGSVFKGEIISYEQGKQLSVKLNNGQLLTVEDSQIEKIIHGIAEIKERNALKEKPYLPPVKIREKQKPADYKISGWYNTTFISFGGGKDGSNNTNDFILASGLHNITGRQWKPWFGFGLGFGVDNYSRQGETIFPVYVDLRGFPIKKTKQVYYAMAGGYGIAFKRESAGILNAKGGYLFHPALGIRFGTADDTNVNIDFGIKFQKAFFRKDLASGDIEERNVIFRRLVLRVGLTIWK